MGSVTYRSANLIIQIILETLLRADTKENSQSQGMLKSHVIREVGLKTAVAEKYLLKMEQAGYICVHSHAWGERLTFVYEITPKGRERYEWFVKINTELE